MGAAWGAVAALGTPQAGGAAAGDGDGAAVSHCGAGDGCVGAFRGVRLADGDAGTVSPAMIRAYSGSPGSTTRSSLFASA